MKPHTGGTILILFNVLLTAKSFAAPYSYDPSNKRDPFRPMPLNESSLAGMGVLEQYDVRELRLSGTLLGLEPSALLITPSNEAVIAHVGDRIGKRGGYLMNVTRDAIIVREPVNGRSTNRSLSQQEKHRDVSIQIQENERSDPTQSKATPPSSDSSLFSGTEGSTTWGPPPSNSIPENALPPAFPPPAPDFSGTTSPSMMTPPFDAGGIPPSGNVSVAPMPLPAPGSTK